MTAIGGRRGSALALSDTTANKEGTYFVLPSGNASLHRFEHTRS